MPDATPPSLTAAELAARIDHTILNADATPEAVAAVVDEARSLGCASACVNPRYLAAAIEALAGSTTVPCVVVAFPLGCNLPHTKSVEAVAAAKAGAAEIDFVAHLPHLLDADAEAATEDFLSVTRPAREVNPDVVVKVIIESACLMRDVSEDQAESRIAAACRAAAESGCDFVKTSTGFHPAGGASVEAVRLMRSHAPHLRVKASGGIRTAADAARMLAAGADRLGCSATRAILGEADTAAAGAGDAY